MVKQRSNLWKGSVSLELLESCLVFVSLYSSRSLTHTHTHTHTHTLFHAINLPVTGEHDAAYGDGLKKGRAHFLPLRSPAYLTAMLCQLCIPCLRNQRYPERCCHRMSPSRWQLRSMTSTFITGDKWEHYPCVSVIEPHVSRGSFLPPATGYH